jgi:chemotaxis protein histidine kinase CheA
MNEQYLSIFIDESREYVQSLNESLLKLEKNPRDEETVNETFRILHTLKGMAGTMGFERMAKLTHRMEQLLDKVRSKKIALTSDLLDRLFAGVDMIDKMVNNVASGGNDQVNEEDLKSLMDAFEVVQEQKVEEQKVQSETKKESVDVEDSVMKVIHEAEPLVHLLRNAIDHGIETKEERIAKGKPPVGTVVLSARHEGNNVVIEVKDDGRGIDRATVLKKAIEKGLISEAQAENLSDEKVYEFLFLPGFSTRSNATELSGRGVGMDVVKNVVESLNGTVKIESVKDRGTTVTIRLPLTLAIIQALLVTVNNHVYAIPIANIDSTLNVPANKIQKLQDKLVTVIRGEIIPLVKLWEVFGLNGHKEEQYYNTVIVRMGNRKYGLVVDSLIGQEDIVIKSLGKIFNDVRIFSGGAILGDGSIALILDVSNIV